MSRIVDEFDRKIVLQADGVTICDGLHIAVHGKSAMNCMPDLFQVDVYNPTEADVGRMQTAGTVSVQIGTLKSLLIDDKPIDIVPHIDRGIKIVSMVYMPGERLWLASVNISFRKKTSYRAILSALLAAGGTSLIGSTEGLPAAPQRGQSYFGKAIDGIDEIVRSAHKRGWTHENRFYLADKGNGSVSYTLTDDDVLSPPGVIGSALIIEVPVGTYIVGRMVSLALKENQGVFRIASHKIDADTDTGEWYSTLTVINEDAISTSDWEGIL